MLFLICGYKMCMLLRLLAHQALPLSLVLRQVDAHSSKLPRPQAHAQARGYVRRRRQPRKSSLRKGHGHGRQPGRKNRGLRCIHALARGRAVAAEPQRVRATTSSSTPAVCSNTVAARTGSHSGAEPKARQKVAKKVEPPRQRRSRCPCRQR